MCKWSFAGCRLNCRAGPRRASERRLANSTECGACAGAARPVHQSVKMAQIERAMQIKRSGANAMQDKQHMEDILRERHEVLPESYGEAHSQEVEKGRIECKQGGVKEDIREAASELVQRPIQDGVPGQICINIRSCRRKKLGGLETVAAEPLTSAVSVQFGWHRNHSRPVSPVLSFLH